MANRVKRAYNIAELRKLAEKRLPAPMFHYIDGGADDEWTLKRNTSAFDAWEFQPRCLVDVAEIDMSTTVFGERIEWPFFCSPTALSRLFHYQGERAVIRAAEAAACPTRAFGERRRYGAEPPDAAERKGGPAHPASARSG